LKVVLYIIWAVLVAAAVAACIYALRKAKRREKLIASWPKVRATVTGSRAGWTSGAGNTTRNRRYWPRYQFATTQGVIFTGESEVSFAEQPDSGSPLEVAYNPDDPRQSFQPAAPSRQVLGCLVPFVAVFAAASFWFIGVFPTG
jgi:hypothetical protein